MNEKDNPYLNGGMPLNDTDLTEEVSNAKSELFASLQSLRRVVNLKKVALKQDEQPSPAVTTPITEEKWNDLKNSTSKIRESASQTQSAPQYNTAPESGFESDQFNSNLSDLNNDNYQANNTGYVPNYRNEQPAESFKPMESFNNETYTETPAEQPVYVNENKAEEQKPVYVVGEKTNKKGKKEKDLPVYSSEADAKSGKKVAWLAYILFFLPLIFAGKNPFVRFHANEGLEINIMDVLGVGLVLTGYYVKTTNTILSFVLLASLALGLVLLILTTITKIVMIILSLCGKTVQTPWLWKTRIIKY